MEFCRILNYYVIKFYKLKCYIEFYIFSLSIAHDSKTNKEGEHQCSHTKSIITI